MKKEEYKQDDLIKEEFFLDNSDFYNVIVIDELRNKDEISTAEEAFMRGYLEDS